MRVIVIKLIGIIVFINWNYVSVIFIGFYNNKIYLQLQ